MPLSSADQNKSSGAVIFAVMLLFYVLVLYTATKLGGRTYWPYMLSAYLMGAFAYWVEARAAATPRGAMGFLFPKDVWTHPSAVNDYMICLINWIIISSVFSISVFNPFIFDKGLKHLAQFIHMPQALGAPAPGFWVLALFALVVTMMGDFFYFLSHMMTHKIPALWEFHKVHHSAEVMTPFTLYRMHPVDAWLNMSMSAVGSSLAALAFHYFHPGLTAAAMAASYGVAFFAIHIIGANLRHSHIWISFGKLEYLLFSPAQHQIHHSTNPKHFDKNFASVYPFWDWMFGSLYITHGKEDITFGIGNDKDQQNYKSVLNLYVHPVRSIWRKRGKARKRLARKNA